MVTLLLIALALVVLSATAWLYSRGIIVHAAALLWLSFVPYEFWFRARCTGECNIRADLVFILPLLLLMTLAGIVWLVHRALRKRKAIRNGT